MYICIYLLQTRELTWALLLFSGVLSKSTAKAFTSRVDAATVEAIACLWKQLGQNQRDPSNALQRYHVLLLN